MSRRGWWSAAIGIALTVGLAAPAGAAETTFDDTCADVYGHRPVGDLEKTTDPAAGNAVMSGQTVGVTLSWPTFSVSGERTHRVLECLSIDGGAPRLWAERQFSSASGTVTLSTVVPDGLSPKSTVCGQSFLKTRGSFGPVTRWSDKTCFPAAKTGSFQAFARSPSPRESSSPQPENRSTPTTRGPLFSSPPQSPPRSSPSSPPSGSGSGDYQAPWPPWEKAPRVSASPPVPSTTTTSTVPAKAAPRKAQGTEAAAPATAPTRVPSQTLPRTGAGVVVLLGVAAVALFSGRTLRKTAHHIEDNLPVEALPVDDEEPTLVLGRRW
jgi:hypothetical protein